jgi:hypothetical protein
VPCKELYGGLTGYSRGWIKAASGVAFLFAFLLALISSAHAQTSGDFDYSATSGSTAEITNYIGSGGAVTTPATINGLLVTEIGSEALSNNANKNSITSVMISGSVTAIDWGAFSGCSSMTSISFPATLTSIAAFVFNNCTALTSISVAPGNTTFSSNGGVLFDAAQATLIQFPAGMEGNYTIPLGVTSIEASSFESSSLTSLTFPASVTSIGNAAFIGARGLVTAAFLGNAPATDGSAFVGADTGITVYYFTGATGFTSPTWNGAPAISSTTPVITSTLSATGTYGDFFNYTITTASNNITATYSEIGLPSQFHPIEQGWPFFEGVVGEPGIFPVELVASNALGSSSATLIITIPFEPIVVANTKGTYTGIASLGGTNVGLFTASVTNLGIFTCKLILPTGQYPALGQFDSYGNGSGLGRVGGTTIEPQLLANPAPGAISGNVQTVSAAGTFNYAVQAGLVGAFNARTFIPIGGPGRYTLVLPAASGTDPALPQGSGYGTMTVYPTGAVSLSARLGDGTPVVTRSQLHTDESWPLFALLYPGRHPGSIAGVMTLNEPVPDSDCHGTVDWLKPAQNSGRYYPNGFTTSLDFMAAKYNLPALDSGTSPFTLGGGNLPNPCIVDTANISASDSILVTGSGKVILGINPASGGFTGSFIYPGSKVRLPFGGVIYQKPKPAAYGTFLGPDQSGAVEFGQ